MKFLMSCDLYGDKYAETLTLSVSNMTDAMRIILSDFINNDGFTVEEYDNNHIKVEVIKPLYVRKISTCIVDDKTITLSVDDGFNFFEWHYRIAEF
jgi:hypothetical protein